MVWLLSSPLGSGTSDEGVRVSYSTIAQEILMKVLEGCVLEEEISSHLQKFRGYYLRHATSLGYDTHALRRKIIHCSFLWFEGKIRQMPYFYRDSAEAAYHAFREQAALKIDEITFKMKDNGDRVLGVCINAEDMNMDLYWIVKTGGVFPRFLFHISTIQHVGSKKAEQIIWNKLKPCSFQQFDSNISISQVEHPRVPEYEAIEIVYNFRKEGYNMDIYIDLWNLRHLKSDILSDVVCKQFHGIAVAFMMGIHSKLGRKSLLQILDENVLRMIMEYYLQFLQITVHIDCMKDVQFWDKFPAILDGSIFDFPA
jgi:hypothetical protein